MPHPLPWRMAKADLDAMLEELRGQDLDQAHTNLQTLERLVHTTEEAFDDNGHARRVAELSALLARKIGLPDEEVSLIRRAAPLHDIGLIGIPEEVLLKPGSLTEAELELVRSHVHIGAKMLSFGESAILKMARLIVLTHHERFDGSGYPYQLEGDDIPVAGQIVAIADFFDTLTHRRPYRRAYSVEEAVAKIRRRSGSEFNPRLVTAFMRVLTEHDEKLRSQPRNPGGLELRGVVDVDTLFDLLVSLTHHHKSGKLFVYVGLREAVLFIQLGNLVHAEFDGQSGESALIQLLSRARDYPNMEFALEPWRGPLLSEDRFTIRTPTQQLLLSATVELDHQVEELHGAA